MKTESQQPSNFNPPNAVEAFLEYKQRAPIGVRIRWFLKRMKWETEGRNRERFTPWSDMPLPRMLDTKLDEKH